MPATLDDVLAELTAIRLLLASQVRSTASVLTPATPNNSSTAGSDVIPQPNPIMDLAEAQSVEVHFGKNKGLALGTLSERSLSWYATEQPPRLDSAGKPYPARTQEITLRNAARTVYHTRAGTLVSAPASVDEEVPF